MPDVAPVITTRLPLRSSKDANVEGKMVWRAALQLLNAVPMAVCCPTRRVLARTSAAVFPLRHSLCSLRRALLTRAKIRIGGGEEAVREWHEMGRRRRLRGFALVLSAVALWTPRPGSAHVVGNLTDDEHHDWQRLETHARRVQSVCSLPDENGGESIDDVACTLALLDAGFADLHPHSTIGRKLLEEREGGFRVPIPILTKEGFRASKLSIWLPSLADLLPSSHSDPYEFFYFVKRILTWIDNIFVKFSIADAKCDFYAPTYRPELKLLVAPEIKCTRPRLTTSVCLAVKPPIADLLPFELHLPLCIPIRLIVEAVNILANLDVVIDGILEAAMDRVDASAMPAARAYVACGGSVQKIATFVSDVGSALGATATATEREDLGSPLPVLNAMSALLLDPGLQQSASSALRLPCLLKDENAREAALAAAGQLAGKEVVPLLEVRDCVRACAFRVCSLSSIDRFVD